MCVVCWPCGTHAPQPWPQPGGGPELPVWEKWGCHHGHMWQALVYPCISLAWCLCFTLRGPPALFSLLQARFQWLLHRATGTPVCRKKPENSPPNTCPTWAPHASTSTQSGSHCTVNLDHGLEEELRASQCCDSVVSEFLNQMFL